MARITPTTGQPFEAEVRLANTGELPAPTKGKTFFVVNAGEGFDAFFTAETGGTHYSHLSFLLTPIANPDAQGTPQNPWPVAGGEAPNYGDDPHRFRP